MKDKCERLSKLMTGLESSSPASANAAVALLMCAEDLSLSPGSFAPDAVPWHRYLEMTGVSGFLQMLPDREHRCRWAKTAFKAISGCGS
jgi:hypothetical protein